MTAHCGFMINAGSRDERTDEHGLAHLIEHCLFKGTERRKAYHILSRLDSVGGEINAYTTKEETCIYASVLKEHFQRAGELLMDITFHSTFPDREIEKEQSIIVDEINSYKENPDEVLMDEFEERLFPGDALGRSILGTAETVQGFGRNDLKAFVNRHYTTDQIVFVCVGNVSKRSILHFCKQWLEHLPASTSNRPERKKLAETAFSDRKHEQVHQVHALIGCRTIGFDDDKRRAMILLNNVLGGPALNSRLNLNIRERHGYCYYIESNYTPYADAGIFQIYYGTDQRHQKKVERLIIKELKALAKEPMKDRTLNIAQKQLLGQIALSQENRVSLMMSAGRSLLLFDRIDSFQEIKDDVMTITAEEVRKLAEETFLSAPLSYLTYIPE
jgi:predicted Zn-dependent peptidase